jgi:YggT family protein
MNILASLLDVYFVCLILRAVLSWFPPPQSGFMATVGEFLFSITEPVLAPVRKILPPLGGLDLSFLVVVIALQVLRAFIGGKGLF